MAPGPPSRLTATGRVVLAMIAYGRNTGYDIKQFVDRTTRFFWAASYGQIYPELRRLEELDLIAGRAEPTGGRARTVYEITDAGRRALEAWLTGSDEPLYELRDEAMLKLFFSELGDGAQRLAIIRGMREHHEHKLAVLRAIEPHARRTGPRLTLEIGIGISQWMVEWCRATELRMMREPALTAATTATGDP